MVTLVTILNGASSVCDGDRVTLMSRVGVSVGGALQEKYATVCTW